LKPIARGKHRGRKKREGDFPLAGVAGCSRVAVATRGRRKGRVEWKDPDHHAVAAHQLNIPDSLV
jgi:hypothetical protein